MIRTTIGVVALFLAACSGSGESGDGGQDADGSQVTDNNGGLCGAAHCLGSEICVNSSVCVSKPDVAAQACVEVQENVYQCQEPADLSCHNLSPCTTDPDCPQDASGKTLSCRSGFCAVPPPAAAPASVTYKGCVDAFGINQNTVGTRLAVYTGSQDPSKSSPLDVEVVEDRDHCSSYGSFSIANVPTNTPLVVKSYDPNGGFVTTYKYNVVLWADLATDEGGGNFVFDARTQVQDPRTGSEIELLPWRGYAISQATYNVILLTLGISRLPTGHGAVAGTVRDCKYRPIRGARCGFVQAPDQIAYFNNAENPRPDKAQKFTNNNGLYAGIDLPAGKHRISCVAQDAQGNPVPLGEIPFTIFGDGITIVNLDWVSGLP